MYVINNAHRIGVTAIATTSDCKRVISGGGEGEVLFLKAESFFFLAIAPSLEQLPYRKLLTCVCVCVFNLY